MSSSQRMTSTLTSNVSAAFGQSRFSVRLCVTKCCLGLGIVLGVLGAALLVAFGFLYIKPYTKVKDMAQTLCVATNVTLAPQLRKCPCGSDCEATYPCLQVRVNYTRKSGSADDDVISDAILYDSYETYSIQRSADEQCSYHACDTSTKDNFESVVRFQNRYDDRSDPFPCYYQPPVSSYVLVDVVTPTDIVHAVLWPGLAFLSGAIILSVYIFDLSCKRSSTPLSASPFNSLEKPWLRHMERNYEKVGTLSEYNGENETEEDNDAADRLDLNMAS